MILSKEIYEITNDEIQSLIGDTNLFIQYDNEDDDDNDENNTVINNNDQNNQNNKIKIGEVEIMIAEKLSRGKHYGWESMLLMLHYGYNDIKINKFVAKIGIDNEKSINMFKKMKFIEIKRSEIFNEITFERNITNDWIEWLEKQIKYVREIYN